MRELKVEDIFKKKFSVVNGNVEENENGQYYNKHIAEYIAQNEGKLDEDKKKKTIQYDEQQIKIKAIKYFKNKYTTILLHASNDMNLLREPSKKYEIFNLNGKTFLTETRGLPNGDNKELYYNFEIANKIYQIITDIKDSALNDYEEIHDLYKKEILEKENEIEELKVEDRELYEEDIKIYEIVSQTTLFNKYNLLIRDKEYLQKENDNLRETLTKYDETIKELGKKLNTSLARIETLQRPKTFAEKIKDLFNSNNKQLLLLDKNEHK